MIAKVVWAIGLVLCVEGLVLALLPGRLDALLQVLQAMPVETRRAAGLMALAGGVLLLWLVREAGA